jgi:hypothetical protein
MDPTNIKIIENRKLDVRGSVHHGAVHKENPTRCNSVSTFIIPYL